MDNALVTGIFGPGLLSYLSRVDNRSGDGTFVLPFYAKSMYIIPVDWQVIPQVTFPADVTVTTLTYTGPDGSDVIVGDPPSGWTETLTITSPAEFCVKVVAEGSGLVRIDILATRPGDPGAHHYQHLEGAGGDPIEKCIELY